MQSVRVTLPPAEYSGVLRLSERHLRSVPDQIRHILRQALASEGLVDRRLLECGDAQQCEPDRAAL
jgi:plasmid stability protein